MDEIKIAFVGDVCVKREVKIQDDISSYFKSLNYRCCNLEGSFLSDKSKAIDKVGPCIYQEKENSLAFIRKLDFDLYNVGNNHIFDFGDDAIKETMTILGPQNMLGISSDHDGLSVNKLFEVHGHKFRVISVMENSFIQLSNEYDYLSIDSMELLEQIRTAKKNKEFCIVQSHAGAEGLNVPLPEIVRLYRSYIDMGADVVIGHHPHVIQASEEYKGGCIYYSLGNFCFRLSERKDIDYGMILEIVLKQNAFEAIPRFVKFDGNSLSFCGPEKYLEAMDGFHGTRYPEIITEFASRHLNLIYLQYLLRELNVDIHSKKSILIFIFRVLFMRRSITFDPKWIFHNHYIQTNSWLVRHALGDFEEKK